MKKTKTIRTVTDLAGVKRLNKSYKVMDKYKNIKNPVIRISAKEAREITDKNFNHELDKLFKQIIHCSECGFSNLYGDRLSDKNLNYIKSIGYNIKNSKWLGDKSIGGIIISW